MRIDVTELKIGDLVNDDVHNVQGLHLVSANKILSEMDIRKMLSHRIETIEVRRNDSSLSSSSLQALSPQQLQVYSDAIQGMKELFQSAKTEGIISKESFQRNYANLLLQFQDEKDLVSLLLNLNKKDEYTYEHCVQVGILSYFISLWLELDQEEAFVVGQAGYLHDIGKSIVDNDILLKPAKLTEKEFDEMKRHTTYGHQILQKSLGANNIFSIVALEHHERLNSKGYPMQKNSAEIHFYSKIVAVADIFDAMTSNRVYQKKRNLLFVLKELHRMSFGELDPVICHTFIENLLPYFVGKKVVLSNGQIGVIVMIHLSNFFRPLVQVNDEFLDLSLVPNIEIESIIMD